MCVYVNIYIFRLTRNLPYKSNIHTQSSITKLTIQYFIELNLMAYLVKRYKDNVHEMVTFFFLHPIQKVYYKCIMYTTLTSTC